GAVVRHAGVDRAVPLDGRLADRVPEQVVVGDEARLGGALHPQVVLAGGEAVVDRDAVVEGLAGGVALDREAVLVVAPGDVADVDVAGGQQVVIAVVAVLPRAVLDRQVVVGAGLDLEPGVLVVVEAVVADHVVGAAEQVEAIRLALAGQDVAGALVVLEGGVGDTAEHRDAVIGVIVDQVG